MSPEDVPAELAEAAAREITDYLHGNSAWIPPQHWQIARNALAAVLPLHEADLLEALRLIDGEMDEADDFDGLNADAVQRIGWYIDPVRARLRAAETESEGGTS